MNINIEIFNSRVTHILNCQISKALFRCNRLVGSRDTQVFNLVSEKPEMEKISIIIMRGLVKNETYL